MEFTGKKVGSEAVLKFEYHLYNLREKKWKSLFAVIVTMSNLVESKST